MPEFLFGRLKSKYFVWGESTFYTSTVKTEFYYLYNKLYSLV